MSLEVKIAYIFPKEGNAIKVAYLVSYSQGCLYKCLQLEVSSTEISDSYLCVNVISISVQSTN